MGAGLVDKSSASGAVRTRYLSAGGRKMEENGKIVGVFVEQVPAGTAGSIARTNMNGKVVHEMYYNSELIGRLINTDIVPNNYDGQLTIKMTLLDSAYGRWQVEMPVRSAHGRSFFQAMYNINPAYEIAIEPVFFVGTNRRTNAPQNVQYFKFFHIDESNGVREQVQYWFTNEAPGQVPVLVDTVYQGKPVKDDTARVNFLVNAHHQWSQGLFAEEKIRAAEYKAKQAAEKAGAPQQAGYPQAQYSQPVQQYQQPPVPKPPVQVPQHNFPVQPQYPQMPAGVQMPPAPNLPPVQYQQPLGTPPPQHQPAFTPPQMPAQTSRPPGAPQQQPMMRPPQINPPQVPPQGSFAPGEDDSDLPF